MYMLQTSSLDTPRSTAVDNKLVKVNYLIDCSMNIVIEICLLLNRIPKNVDF